jgi:hypothetical protein
MLARQGSQQNPADWGDGSLQPDLPLLLEVLAGGAVTVPKLFVSNTNPPRLGLIAQRNVVGFDEVAGSAFDAEHDKNLYKSYMENGQINRRTITVPGEAAFMFNGNINFDPRQSMQAEHLFKPLPSGIADDTAFHMSPQELPLTTFSFVPMSPTCGGRRLTCQPSYASGGDRAGQRAQAHSDSAPPYPLLA